MTRCSVCTARATHVLDSQDFCDACYLNRSKLRWYHALMIIVFLIGLALWWLAPPANAFLDEADRDRALTTYQNWTDHVHRPVETMGTVLLRIDVYDGPDGSGKQAILMDTNGSVIETFADGPEAAWRTYDRTPAAITTTTL